METQVETNEKQPSPSLIGIITSPVETFERIRKKPKIWVPLLIVTVIEVLAMWLMGRLLKPSDLAGQGIPDQDLGMAVEFTKYTMIGSGAITPILTVLVSSAIYLAIAKIAGSPVSFKQLFSMNTYLVFVTSIGHLLNMIIGNLIGTSYDTHVTSLAGLLGKDGAGVLAAIEVFTIWSTILTAIGLHKVAGLSKWLSWTVAIIFFLLGILLAVVGSMVPGGA
ncbi:hypothetical protein A8F94_18235 [Bacillus sp. FJAT-27225]|uniref:Yip1 family protein n=1 Tax=Bacillus sp. FJAT-27225 TaxID=1743144 RepID=UPI00080C24EB|nr:Yip1 family protein [Bacillus sp. FJAT-27225]OCA83075.1 hypothetical protein A8F94_18235 [Bacillus sp. FJAT-27225]